MFKINKNIIAERAKGLLSLMAVFLLVFSVSAKDVSNKFQLEKGRTLSFVQKGTGETKVYRINSVPDEDQEDLSEVELDDIEFFTFDSYTLSSVVLYIEKSVAFPVFQFTKITKLPLYALFCKWKFHLS
ncbi:hypothetical protein NAT51_04040 [Flavobacterium amniphilum]|uniref:hypothetical protein n=1 Tax=Flavobacterium amniphilum TaxID=1834035 RepID=UPI00202A23F3|nr:hypothetical protein [Flavobacterium amniphilum]MCL9804678.1 hypothetical protein [Flavobacterium amniphilum]